MQKVLWLTVVTLTCIAALPMQLETGTSSPPDVDRVCKLKDGADVKIPDILNYLCSGPLDCAPINPGGDHYQPNTPLDHANWAVNAFYVAHKDDPDISSWYLSCFFGGATELSPPFPNLLFLQTNAASGNHGALVPSTAYPSGVGVTDTLTEGDPYSTYRSTPINGTFDATCHGKGQTVMSLWMAGKQAQSVADAFIEYDFNGDGKFDRIEYYKNANEGVVPQYEPYTQGVGEFNVTGSATYEPMVNGYVTLRVAAVGGPDDSLLLQSTDQFPSIVVIPYS